MKNIIGKLIKFCKTTKTTSSNVSEIMLLQQNCIMWGLLSTIHHAVYIQCTGYIQEKKKKNIFTENVHAIS